VLRTDVSLQPISSHGIFHPSLRNHQEAACHGMSKKPPALRTALLSPSLVVVHTPLEPNQTELAFALLPTVSARHTCSAARTCDCVSDLEFFLLQATGRQKQQVVWQSDDADRRHLVYLT